MPLKATQRQQVQERFPHEQTWLREFVGFHGTDRVTSYYKEDLGGVSLTRIIEAIACGEVIYAEKLNEPGTNCNIFHSGDDDAVSVFVHFVANEERMTILKAEWVKESGDDPDRAA